MALKKCKDCGAEISKSAKVCPQCGKSQRMPVWLRAILIIFLLMIMVAAAASNNSDNTSTVNSNNVFESKSQSGVATLEIFNQVEIGMSYEEVVQLVGAEGTLSTESGYANQTMKVYYWYSSNGISNMTISFMNGKVSAKNQIGLD